MYDTLLLSAGGSLGLSFIGAIEALVDSNKLDLNKVNTIAGISVGSIVGLFLILFRDIKYIKELVINLNLPKMDNCKDGFYFLEFFGFENGEKIMFLLKSVIETKYDPNITFKELFKETKIFYIIQATNLNKYCLTTFSHVETPDLSVIDAIRMSISIPFYFTPIKYLDDYYVDGGVLTYSPHIDNLVEENTILFQVKVIVAPENSYPSFIDYMLEIWICFFYNRIEKVTKYPTINIKLENAKLLPSKEEALKLFARGYAESNAFIESVTDTISAKDVTDVTDTTSAKDVTDTTTTQIE
jgi:hypothetical protein